MANSVRMCLTQIMLLALALSMLSISCTAHENNNSSTLQVLNQLTEKLMTKLNTHLFSPNRAKARGYEYSPWSSYMDSYSSHDVYGKSDYSWIIPLIIVVGFGTLLIPLMGTLMTTMVTQGTINLTAGRRRRRNAQPEPLNNSATNWSNVLRNVEEAMAKFGKQFKQFN